MTTIQDMHAAVDAAAQAHFEWCTDHDYENETDPEVQLCRSVFALNLESADHDDVSTIAVTLAGSHTDELYGFPVPQASIGINGRPADFEIAPWKLTPIAFALLAAQARAEGDEDRARAFMDAAQAAITEHASETETAPAEDTKPWQPETSWVNGPFSYVMGGDPDGPLIPWDVYQAAQEAAKQTPAPQFVVQPTTEAGHWQVGGVDPRYNGRSVDGHDYTDFDTAKRAATVLNAAKAVFDSAPVGHHLDRTQPHPRAIKDCARNVYGIEPTDAEITAAVKVVMA